MTERYRMLGSITEHLENKQADRKDNWRADRQTH